MTTMHDNTPLLLLPGLLCDAALWAPQMHALRDVAQPQVADLTQDDSVAAMARRALDAAPPRFALAALSMGGYVAFEILRQAPERVLRLALLATSAAADTAQRQAQRRATIAFLSSGKFAGVTQQLLPQLVHARHVDGPVGQTVREMATRVGQAAFIRQQSAILGRPDSRPLLPSLRLPTLIAVGEDDRLTPPTEARVMHEGIANSQLHVLPDCGHLPPRGPVHAISGVAKLIPARPSRRVTPCVHVHAQGAQRRGAGCDELPFGLCREGAVCGVAHACKARALLRACALHPAPSRHNAIP